MDLSEIREEIDKIDEQLVNLFIQRMNLSAQVADYKKAHNLPIFVPARESEILQKIAVLSGPDLAPSIQSLYTTIFQVSRDYQAKHNAKNEVIG